MSEPAKHVPTPWECTTKDYRNQETPFSFYIHGDLGDSEPDDEGNVTEATAVAVAIVPGNATGRDVAEATARFIVKAANCHDELLAELRRVLAWLDRESELVMETGTGSTAGEIVDEAVRVKTAIAKATGAPIGRE